MKKEILKDDGYSGSASKGSFSDLPINKKTNTDEVFDILKKMAIETDNTLVLSALDRINCNKIIATKSCCEYCGTPTIDFDMCDNCKELLA